MTPVYSMSTGLVSMKMLLNNPAYVAPRAVFMGGATGLASSTAVKTMDYITITTTGNATSFGDMITALWRSGGCSSATRGISGGGTNTGGTVQSVSEYITIATTGNATNFGNLTVARRGLGSLSSSTRGIWAGGYTGADSSVIDYVTIATTGNATNFGNLAQAVFDFGGGAGSSTRGIFGAGAYNGGGNYYNGMQYITIATTGNATFFGNLSANIAGCSGMASSSTRWISSGGTNTGGTDLNVMDYVTIATTGNSTDFGDLTVARTVTNGATSDSSRMIIAGGFNSSVWSAYNVLDYVTIATTGNATDFGDLSQSRGGCQVAVSNSHGGLA